MPTPHFHFVIPDPNAFPSGGNLYNKFFMEGLARNDAKVTESRLKGVSSIIDQKEPLVLIFDTLFLDSLTELPSNFLANETCFLLVHHLESLYPPKGNYSKDWFEWRERTQLEPFKGFITSSEYTASYLRVNGISQPVWAVPPALCMMVPELTERKLDADKPVKVVIVANLIERKGIREFLIGLGERLTETDYLNVAIYGTDQLEPEYAGDCKLIVEENPLLKKSVHFMGAGSTSLLESAYREANIFVSSSKMETFGMALQEAVAFRLPILAVKGGNVEWHIKPGVNGEVFENSEALVETLLEWTRDFQLLQKRMDQAFSFKPYQAYSWDDVTRDFLDKF